jgi:hypothetical protein
VRHLLRARRGNGGGIHSPFLYRFITMVLNTHWAFYAFEDLEEAKSELSCKRKIRLYRHSSGKENSVERILFRMVQDQQPATMLEIGNLCAIDTLFLTKACPTAIFLSTTSFPDSVNFIEASLKKGSDSTVQLCKEPVLKQALTHFEKLDFVLFNAPVGQKQRLSDFHACLSKAVDGSIFVMKNIHQTQEQESTWNIIRKHPKVKVSIDLFSLGILLFRSELTKKHLRIRI